MTVKTLAQRINRRLRKQGYEFGKRELQHGWQFRFEGGVILIVFNTGTTQWQGACDDRDEELDGVVAEARAALLGPGLFGRK